MGIFSNRVEASELEAGDHIYTWRANFIYADHGIYLGAGKVMHRAEESSSTKQSKPCMVNGKFEHFTYDESILLTDPATPLFRKKLVLLLPFCESTGFRQKSGGMTISCLFCFLGNGSLYRFHYGVSAFAFKYRLRNGTCTTSTCDPADDVIDRALGLYWDGFCHDEWRDFEDAAVYCKTGLFPNRDGEGQRSYAQRFSSFVRSAVEWHRYLQG